MMSDVMKSYAAMERAYVLSKDLDLVLEIEDNEWILRNESDEYGMMDEDVEELYVTGETPFELLQFLQGFEAGLQSEKVYTPKRTKKKKAPPK